MSKRNLFVTSSSQWHQEQDRNVPFQYWGGNRQLKLRPFQIRHLEPNKVSHKDYLEGISFAKLKKHEQLEKNCVRHAIYFFPNDVETQVYQKGGNGKEWPERALARKHKQNNEYKNVQILANLYFCFVDYDPPKIPMSEDELCKHKMDFISKLDSFEPRPDVIVDSGRGIHAYWAIKPIRLVDLSPERAKTALLRFKEAQKILQTHFKTDVSTVTDRGKLMRVPNSWNIKSSTYILWCKYIRGDLCAARENPKRTLKQFLKAISKEKIKTAKKRGPKKRPKIVAKGANEALNELKNLMGVKRLPEALKRVFKYYFGLAWASSVLEGKYARNKLMRVNGKQHRAARQVLIDLGLIEQESRASYAEGKAARYVFTEKFDLLFKIERPEKQRNEREIIEEVIHSPCPSGERIKQMPKRLNRLIYEGEITDPVRLRNILVQWIDNRPDGLPRDYGQIDYYIKTHWKLMMRNEPKA